jgi:hypothetical protein
MATGGTIPPATAGMQRNIEIDKVRIPEPMWSVNSRLSWGALLAGGVVALAMYFLMSLLGVALGVTFSDRFTPEQLGRVAAGYSFAALIVCMFVGGWVSTRCTAGEFRSEAALYGVIVWAVTSSVLIPLTALGIGTGVSTVLAAHGIAKVKTDIIPAIANAKDMAKQKVDSAKKQVAKVKDKVEQTANGDKADDKGQSDHSANSTAKSDDSSDSSDDNKSTSNASDSQEKRAKDTRESTSSDDSGESSNRPDRASKDESTDNTAKTPHQTREELRAASWWAFGGSSVSLIAAILGAILGPTISVVRHEIPAGRSPNVRTQVPRL